MNSFLLLSVLCILSVGQVFCQQPSSGATSLVGDITGGVSDANPGPTRWIAFDDPQNDWSKLGNTFTIEAWIWHSTQGASSWQPIIARHPGMNEPKENAHFSIIIRNRASVEVYAGCGCVQNVCGQGYVLSAPFQSGVWQHVAVTFDGDDSIPTSSQNATLYINGIRVAQTNWASQDHNCVGRKMMYQNYADVKVGYFDDEQVNVGSEGNPQQIKGWWGRIDEIRFWLGDRTAQQIGDYHDVGLKGTETNLFTYYQFSPSMEMLQDPTQKKWISNKVGDYLNGLPYPDVYSPDIFLQTTNSPISSMARVLGQSDADDLPMIDNMVHFESWPEDDETLYEVNPVYSPALQALINAGQAHIVVSGPQVSTITVHVTCPDNNCMNYQTNWKQYYIDYRAVYDNTPTQSSSRLFLSITNSCPSGIFDECGECEGDNTLCQCVEYHSFDAERMTHIMLEWSLTNLIEEVRSAIDILVSTTSVLDLSAPTDDLGVLRQQISDIMSFYNDDLTNYCGDLSEFQTDLHSALPRTSDSMLDNSAQSQADGAIPYIPKFVPKF